MLCAYTYRHQGKGYGRIHVTLTPTLIVPPRTHFTHWQGCPPPLSQSTCHIHNHHHQQQQHRHSHPENSLSHLQTKHLVSFSMAMNRFRAMACIHAHMNMRYHPPRPVRRTTYADNAPAKSSDAAIELEATNSTRGLQRNSISARRWYFRGHTTLETPEKAERTCNASTQRDEGWGLSPSMSGL